MGKYRHSGLSVKASSQVLFTAACVSPTPAVAPTPLASPAPPPAATPLATTLAAQAIGQLALAGKAAFARSCAKCHGENGQVQLLNGLVKGLDLLALPLIGHDADIAAFGNSRLLYDFISTQMPLDVPGSLSREDYLGVLSFLLVENGLAPTDRMVTASQLLEMTLQPQGDNRNPWNLSK